MKEKYYMVKVELKYKSGFKVFFGNYGCLYVYELNTSLQ